MGHLPSGRGVCGASWLLWNPCLFLFVFKALVFIHGSLYVDMVSNVSGFWASVKILDIPVVELMSAAGEVVLSKVGEV